MVHRFVARRSRHIVRAATEALARLRGAGPKRARTAARLDLGRDLDRICAEYRRLGAELVHSGYAGQRLGETRQAAMELGRVEIERKLFDIVRTARPL